LKAAKSNFSEAKTILCLFHWKQAIRRKLLALKLDEDIISALIRNEGLLELLTYIPIEDIESKGFSIPSA
jgi:hypothetical protein